MQESVKQNIQRNRINENNSSNVFLRISSNPIIHTTAGSDGMEVSKRKSIRNDVTWVTDIIDLHTDHQAIQ